MMGWEPIVMLILVGVGVLVLCKLPFERFHFLGVVALAFWTGTLSVSFSVILVAVITGRFFLSLLWVWVGVSVVVLIIRRKEVGSLVPGVAFPRAPFGWVRLLLAIPLLVLMFESAYQLFTLAISYPMVSIDALGNFGLKGKLWYTTRQLFPAQLLDPEYLMYKRRYPPVLPVSEVLWASLGGWDGRKLKFFFLACWVAVGFLVFSILYKRGNTLTGWVGMAIWLLLPYNLGHFAGGAVSGYGDVPIAMAFLCALMVLQVFWDSKNLSQVVLMGVLIAGTFWIKKEGVPFVVFVLILLLWKRASLRNLVVTLAVSAVFYLVYYGTTLHLPHFLEKDVSLQISGAEMWERGKNVIAFLYEEWSITDRWGSMIWYMLLAAWIFKVYALRLRGLFNIEFPCFLFMLGIYTVVLVFTCFDFWQNARFAFNRLFIQIYPLALIATWDGLELTLKVQQEGADGEQSEQRA